MNNGYSFIGIDMSNGKDFSAVAVMRNGKQLTVCHDQVIAEALIAMSEQLAALQEENQQLKEAYGCHVQADAYSFGFPENEADYQYNKKQATWWRLLSRNCIPRNLDFECAELAKAVARRSEIREEK